jgi:hypothetical protein
MRIGCICPLRAPARRTGPQPIFYQSLDQVGPFASAAEDVLTA